MAMGVAVPIETPVPVEPIPSANILMRSIAEVVEFPVPIFAIPFNRRSDIGEVDDELSMLNKLESGVTLVED
jgi:hypothetical protein